MACIKRRSTHNTGHVVTGQTARLFNEARHVQQSGWQSGGGSIHLRAPGLNQRELGVHPAQQGKKRGQLSWHQSLSEDRSPSTWGSIAFAGVFVTATVLHRSYGPASGIKELRRHIAQTGQVDSCTCRPRGLVLPSALYVAMSHPVAPYSRTMLANMVSSSE